MGPSNCTDRSAMLVYNQLINFMKENYKTRSSYKFHILCSYLCNINILSHLSNTEAILKPYV